MLKGKVDISKGLVKKGFSEYTWYKKLRNVQVFIDTLKIRPLFKKLPYDNPL